MEDKCPTCPKWGTGHYCDCGSSKYEALESLGCFLVIIVAVICFTLLLIFGK